MPPISWRLPQHLPTLISSFARLWCCLFGADGAAVGGRVASIDRPSAERTNFYVSVWMGIFVEILGAKVPYNGDSERYHLGYFQECSFKPQRKAGGEQDAKKPTIERPPGNRPSNFLQTHRVHKLILELALVFVRDSIAGSSHSVPGVRERRRLGPLNGTNQRRTFKLKSDERRRGRALTKIPSRQTMVPGRSWRTIAILLAAALATTHGFAPVNPSTRSPSTYPAKRPQDPSASDQQPQAQSQAIEERNVAAVRALSAVATARTAEVEEDVSYGVAMVSCVVSLAIGFALGYGTLPS